MGDILKLLVVGRFVRLAKLPNRTLRLIGRGIVWLRNQQVMRCLITHLDS
jgi:hypothetical protein